MWLRISAVADLPRMSGPDKAWPPDHSDNVTGTAWMSSRTCSSGGARGKLQ
jgi:hypothetical protein